MLIGIGRLVTFSVCLFNNSCEYWNTIWAMYVQDNKKNNKDNVTGLIWAAFFCTRLFLF